MVQKRYSVQSLFSPPFLMSPSLDADQVTKQQYTLSQQLHMPLFYPGGINHNTIKLVTQTAFDKSLNS